MFLLHRPSPEDVERFIAACRDLPLSYQPIGLANQARRGFAVDEQLTIVGSGHEAFPQARAALKEWKHFLIRAVSKPRAAPARLGYPVARALQARFRRDSARALARAIAR